MKDKCLIVCMDNLEDFSGFFENMREKAPFNVVSVRVNDLFSKKLKDDCKTCRPADIFIAIEKKAFDTDEDAIRENCNKLESGSPFTNFLYLYTEPEHFNDEGFLSGNKAVYILFKQGDMTAQVIQFTLYIINMFHHALLSSRLADYIYHSFREVVFYEMLKKQKADIEELNKELSNTNRIDNLTNLYNRRALFEFLDKERSRTLRGLQKLGSKDFRLPVNSYPGNTADFPDDADAGEDFIEYFGIFSVMMIDLDYFKTINDSYGHLAGDKVLKTVGDLLQRKDILREQDIAGRFGGDEFIVILPNTNAHNALGPAMRLSQELGKVEFRSTDNKLFRVTLSIGISEYHPTDKDNEAIIYRADQAMYYTKEHGRNQIVIYEKVYD